MNNNLPPSALLDRLKNFLPQIAKANEELEDKIRREGKDAVVIDTNMTESVEADKDVDNDESVEDVKADSESENKPVVQIEFALGDFDNSVIANIEENDSATVAATKTSNEDEDSD